MPMLFWFPSIIAAEMWHRRLLHDAIEDQKILPETIAERFCEDMAVQLWPCYN
jgi:hypothetical protein